MFETGGSPWLASTLPVSKSEGCNGLFADGGALLTDCDTVTGPVTLFTLTVGLTLLLLTFILSSELMVETVRLLRIAPLLVSDMKIVMCDGGCTHVVAVIAHDFLFYPSSFPFPNCEGILFLHGETCFSICHHIPCICHRFPSYLSRKLEAFFFASSA